VDPGRDLDAKTSDAVAPFSPMGFLRLGANLLAAFFIGDALMAMAQPEKQTRLSGPWRTPLRWLTGRPQTTRLLVVGQLAAGLLLAWSTTRRLRRLDGAAPQQGPAATV
jgi:hypothetical protein